MAPSQTWSLGTLTVPYTQRSMSPPDHGLARLTEYILSEGGLSGGRKSRKECKQQVCGTGARGEGTGKFLLWSDAPPRGPPEDMPGPEATARPTPANHGVPVEVSPLGEEGLHQQGEEVQALNEQPEVVGHDTVVEENHYGLALHLPRGPEREGDMSPHPLPRRALRTSPESREKSEGPSALACSGSHPMGRKHSIFLAAKV